jgi:PAS domain S-box-containing protein
MITEDPRKSGIDVVGDIPWGTHLCMLYVTSKDLAEVLVPYFRTGLENNEFCLWVCWEPLLREEAIAEISKEVGDLEAYISKGQIEIVDYIKQHTAEGKTGFDEMVEFWIDKEKLAFERGSQGLRLAGNTYWLEREEWQDFMRYEAKLDEVIRSHRMIAICPYSLDKCNAADVLDVVSSHRLALIRRKGRWDVIQSLEERRLETALESQIQNFRNSLDDSPLGVRIVTAEGELLYANKAILDIYGYSSFDELKSTPAKRRYTPESYAEHRERTRKRKQGESVPSSYEVSIVRKDGEVRQLQVFRKEVVWNGETQFQAIYQDITERRRAEEALRRAQQERVAILNTMSEHVVYRDTTFRILWANRAAAQSVGLAPEQLVGRHCYEIWHQRSETCMVCPARDALETGQAKEEEIITPDGRMWWIRAYPIRDKNSDIVGIANVTLEITERKRAEEKHGTIVATALDGFWLCSAEGRFLEVNDSYCDMIGYEREELLQMSIPDVEAVETPEETGRRIKKIMAQSSDRFESRHKRKDGKVIDVEVSVNYLGAAEGQFSVFVRDITERKKTAEQLIRLSNAVRMSTDSIVISDLEANITDVNEATLAMYGTHDEGDLIGKNSFDLIVPGEREEALGGMREALEKGYARGREYHIVTKDGSEIPVEMDSALIRDATGKPTGFVAVSRDITERKRAEEALQNSARQWRATFDGIGDAVNLMDLQGRILRCNTAMTRLLGKPFGEIIGQTCWKVVHGRSEPVEGCPMVRMRETQRRETLVMPIGDRWLEVTADPLLDETDNLIGAVHIMADITGRKRTEEEIRKLTQYLESVIDNANVVLDAMNLKGSVLVWNRAAEVISGYSREEVVGHNEVWKWLYPDTEYRRAIGATAAAVLEGEVVEDVEATVRTKSREDRTLSWHGTRLLDGEGNPIGSVWVGTDVTDRKRAEAAARRREQELRIIADNLPALVSYLGTDGCYCFANKRYEEWLGVRQTEIIGKHYREVLGEDTYRQIKDRVEAALSGHRVCHEYVLPCPGGGMRWVIADYVPDVGDHGKVRGIFILATDITEREKAENALRESEEFSSSLLNSSPIAMIVINPDTSVRYVNPALEKLTGFSLGELIGRKAPYPWWTEETLEKTGRGLEEAMLKGAQNLEELFQKKNGERFWVEITFSPILRNGESKYYLGNWVDITERKKAEEKERQLQQQLIVASRLASIGRMASGIAHEINNPLTGVVGFSDLLLKKDIPEDIRESVRIIHDGAQRVAGITSRLLTFARQSKPERTCVNINDIIENTLVMRAYEMRNSNIEATTQLDPDLPCTMADAGELQQVFLNIILNAEAEVTRAHGRGNLLVKTEMLDNTIRISFKDDGLGIPKGNLDKIFEPFFTTREVGQGAGLGLSVSHGIVTEHGGRIYAESELGKGATFFVELPIVTEAEQLKPAEPPVAEPERVSRGRILVVDDEPVVQQFLTRMLSEEGHDVETTDNGEDALEKLQSEDYDVILVDIKLPGMSGIEIYKHLRRVAKPLARRVVFITGDVMGEDTMAFLTRAKAPYFAKPLDTERLKKDINSMLTRRR